jgi:hypothetical protein
MPIANYRPIKSVAYLPPGGTPLAIDGILSMSLVESNAIAVEATDGYTHVNNAVAKARTTRLTLRSRDLLALRAVDRAAKGGVLQYTLIGLNGAADIVEQASLCYSRGIRADATVPQPYLCEIAFDCVTDDDYAVGPQS